MLKGNIKAYSADVRAGVIIGLNGMAYGFHVTSWAGPILPRTGEHVTFEAYGRDAWNVASAK